MDLLVANNRNQQYPKIRSCFQKSRNGIQRGFRKYWNQELEGSSDSLTSVSLPICSFFLKMCFLLFLVPMVEYGCPYNLSFKTYSSQPHRHTFSFSILIPNSWEVESDWPSPGSAMLEGSVLKYTSPVGNLLLWMEQSRGDRRDSFQSK